MSLEWLGLHRRFNQHLESDRHHLHGYAARAIGT
jgi:hypothetical protein